MRVLFLTIIRFYKYFLSPFFPAACRFTPTCSEYAANAVMTHGVRKGGWLAMKRILRCHPWGKSGFDPIPDTLNHKNV